MELLQPEDASSPPTAPPAFTIVSPRRVVVSPAIFAVNVLVFAAMVVSGVSFVTPTGQELLRFGANHGPLVAGSEWWRLLTSAFVHVGILHIGLNMWVFRSLGPTAERLFGNAAFLLAYLASAIGASLASILWNPAGVSAGASGAIFGVAGAFLAFFLRHRQAMPKELFRAMTKSMITFVAINTLFGLMVPGIDNAAHLGGLFTGFLAGFALERDVTVPPVLDRRRAVRALVLFAALAALALAVPARVARDPAAGARLHSMRVQEAMRREDWPGVVRVADEWIAMLPDDGHAWQSRGIAHLELGDSRTARADLDRAIELRDDLPFSFNARASLRVTEGDVEGGLRDFDAAVRLRPDDPWLTVRRAHARYHARDWTGALRDFQAVAALDTGELGGEAHLFAWILRSRLTARNAADAGLREALGSVTSTGWSPMQRHVAAHWLGELSEERLIAESPGEELSTTRYYVGMKQVFDGDRAAAEASFRACVESSAGSWAFEAAHAATELALLAE